MIPYLSRLLDYQSLSPHGFCFLWRPELLWTHVISDAVIGFSYMTIPITLAAILSRRRDVPFSFAVWCTALFIASCGVTHFMMILTLWKPYYGAEGLAKVVTALASLGTAVLLWRMIPFLVALPSPSQLRAVNRELQARLAERDAAIAEYQREREERLKVEAALLQAQKMEALGHLTGGIAHDFNNLLQAVQGAFELIGRRASDPEKVRNLAAGGREATDRGVQLTAKMLAFARTKQLTAEPVVVTDVVLGMRDVLMRSLSPRIDLRFDLDSAEIPVLTDKAQLELALVNLTVNARDAMPDGGRLVIHTTPCEAESDDADLAPGSYVCLSVSDDGAGMSAEVASKAFDPFFTTKPSGKGTGLGLSQVYGVAKQTGGAARISSKEGVGTTVSLLLPCSEAEPRKIIAEPDQLLPDLQALTVLVVDDDPLVRTITAESLKELGAEVRTAAVAEEALEKIAGAQVAVVDYLMPGMTGVQLAPLLRQAAPGVRILFITGYGDQTELEGALAPGETVLRKPFHADQLRAELARLLAQSPPSDRP